jgi:Ca2+-binding RTX toxin-like protein
MGLLIGQKQGAFEEVGVPIGASIGGWDIIHHSFSHLGGSTFAITNPDEGTVTVIEAPTKSGAYRVLRISPIGGNPTDVAMDLSHSNGGRTEISLVATDTATDTVSIELLKDPSPYYFIDPLPIGVEPVDVIYARGGRLVVNRGSDEIARLDFDRTTDIENPSFSIGQRLPVGDRPVDIARLKNRYLVTNQGSNSVSIVRQLSSGELVVDAEYPVGSAPTSAAEVKLNSDRFADIAVTNGSSNDISFLLGSASGEFQPAGRMKVGDNPVAVAPISFGPYFNGDLAVANAGDGTISILEWHETSGACAGRPAKLTELTEDDDYWRRGGNPNQLRGFGGDDQIFSGTGRDCVSGGRGRDEINGGKQADRLRGGPGDDLLTGYTGNDIVRGGRGDDFLCEGHRLGSICWGRNSISHGLKDPESTNRLVGGRGDDRIVSGHGKDQIFGGPGNDRISSRRGSEPDRIDCGRGRDIVRAKRGDRLSRCEVVGYGQES